MSDTLIAPTKLTRNAARAVLQEYVLLMDALRAAHAIMERLEPKLVPSSGHPAKAFYDASEAWKTRTATVRTLYDEVERLAVAINLQAL